MSYAMKQGILLWIWWKSMETETATWSEFPSEGKAIVEQILASEKELSPKEQGYENHSLGSV